MARSKSAHNETPFYSRRIAPISITNWHMSMMNQMVGSNTPSDASGGLLANDAKIERIFPIIGTKQKQLSYTFIKKSR